MFMMIDDDQADHGQDYDQNLEDNYDDGCHGHEQGYKELGAVHILRQPGEGGGVANC